MIAKQTETLNQAILRIQDHEFEVDQKEDWTKSPFLKWKTMSSDARGRVGEEVVVNVLARLLNLLTTILKIEWDGNKSIKFDGKYDIRLIVKAFQETLGLRIEVKTTTSGTIQMEPIYLKDEWDILIGLRVTQTAIGFIVLDKSRTSNNIDQILVPEIKKHPLLGVGACLRDERNDGYKLDISHTAIQKAIDNYLGFSYVFGETSESSLLHFFRDRLSVCSGIDL